MAQADQDIANGTGSAVRTDLNSNIDALFSNSSGATEPTTTVAYQFWFDTTANILKIRDSTDSSWVNIASPGLDAARSLALFNHAL